MLKAENKRILQKALLIMLTVLGLFFAASMVEPSVVKASNGSSLALNSLIPADTKLKCRIALQWVGTNNDRWEFEGEYLATDGPDSLKGIFDDPKTAKAELSGKGDKDGWKLLITYLDSNHTSMTKVLSGKGYHERRTNELFFEGDVKTLIGTNDIKTNGKFRIYGRCK